MDPIKNDNESMTSNQTQTSQDKTVANQSNSESIVAAPLAPQAPARLTLPPFKELIEGSFDFFWKNIWKFLGIQLVNLALAFVLFVPAFIIWADIFQKINNKEKFTPGYGFISYMSVACLIMIIAFVWTKIATLLAIRQSEKKLKELLLEAKKHFLNYFKTTFLAGLVITGMLLLFIVPGIIYSIYYSFVASVVVYEGLTGMAALKRSKALVKNYWGVIAGRICLLFLTIIIVQIIADIFKLGSLVQLISGPFAVIFMVRLYDEMIKIKTKAI